MRRHRLFLLALLALPLAACKKAEPVVAANSSPPVHVQKMTPPLKRERAEYTALISHDLRAPLGAIGLLAGAIRRGVEIGAPLQHASDCAARIGANVARMHEMVEEISSTAIDYATCKGFNGRPL